MKLKIVNQDQLHMILTSNINCNCLIVSKEADRFVRKIPCQELGLILDWDDTLTEHSSWRIANNAFSKVGTRKEILLLDKISKHYHSIERERPLTSTEMKAWQRTNMQMYVDHGLNLKCLDKEINKSGMYLCGAILLIYLLESGSKVCISSSGVKNVIEKILKLYGINPNKYENLQIDATELIFNEKGVMTGWENDSIVTVKNKPRITHSFSRIWDIEHRNIFAVGDGNTDINTLDLVSEEATMIFFAPKHKRELMTKQKFDLISNKAHGFVKDNFEVITNFFIQTIGA